MRTNREKALDAAAKVMMWQARNGWKQGVFNEYSLADIIEAEIKPEWFPVGIKPDERRRLLVTNNIDARNAYGEMSHLWLVNGLHEESGNCEGTEIIAFDDGDHKIRNITHWRYALYEEPKTEES